MMIGFSKFQQIKMKELWDNKEDEAWDDYCQNLMV